jgi:hypothetical protein
LEYKNHQVNVIVVPNWGRDVLPFLHVIRKVRAAGYKYVLKLHSKKSKQISRIDATYWLRATIDSLLSSKTSVDKVLKELSEKTKIIGVKEFAVHMSLGGEIGLKKRLLEYYPKQTAKKIIKNLDNYVFSPGSMFWASTDAFDGILARHIVSDDFELEYGQLWNTLAHYIERDIWINTQETFGSDSHAYISATGRIVKQTSLDNVNSDLDFPKVLKSLDKSSLEKIDDNLKVSIIITNYNYGKYIDRAIRSALDQTFKNIEILVIDDGSTDGISGRVISKYTKKHPSKIHSHMLKHQGVVPVRNFGIDNATGDYIVFLDADDILTDDYVKNLLEEAIYGKYDVVYADMHNFGADYRVEHMPEFNRSQMLQRNLVNMSALIRKDAIGKLRFDEYLNTRKIEDWDFFLGLTLSGATFSKSHTTFIKYRVHEGQRNNNLNRDAKFWADHEETLRYIRKKYRDLYPNENIPG